MTTSKWVLDDSRTFVFIPVDDVLSPMSMTSPGTVPAIDSTSWRMSSGANFDRLRWAAGFNLRSACSRATSSRRKATTKSTREFELRPST